MSCSCTTVLIVEDDPDASRLLCDQLRPIPGVTVLTADCGCEALEIIHLAHPDVVLLDLILPDITGFHVLHTIRSLSPERRPRVIALTTAYSEDIKTRVIDLGAEFLFTKPVPATELVPFLWRPAPVPAEDLLERVTCDEKKNPSFYWVVTVLEQLARSPRLPLKEAYLPVMTAEGVSYDSVHNAVSRTIHSADRRGGAVYRAMFPDRPSVGPFLRRLAKYVKVS